MKKTLAILLALFMLASVALVACEGNGRKPVEDDWGDENDYLDESDDSTDESENESESESESGSGNSNTNNNTGWTDTNDTVYVGSKKLNLRTSPSASNDSNIGRQANSGDALTRVSTNGTWDKVKVSGDETVYYAQSKFICTNANNFNFTNLDEPVDLTFVVNKGNVCLYETPFQIYEGNTLLYNNIYAASGMKNVEGTFKKLATTPNGWIKVSIQGKLTKTDSSEITLDTATIFYIDPSTAVSNRINDPSRPSGGGSGGADG